MIGYRHPQGFIKIRLCTIGTRRYRLHLWPRGKAGIQPTPHDHRHDIRSWPIGVFVEIRYAPVDGDDMERAICVPSRPDGPVTPVPAGRSSLVASARYTRALIPYRCPAGIIHAHRPKGWLPAASIVITGPPLLPHSTTYTPRTREEG